MLRLWDHFSDSAVDYELTLIFLILEVLAELRRLFPDEVSK